MGLEGGGSGSVLEVRRLAASVLWALQRRFYAERGPEAWSAGTVPSYVTSNPLIADGYARVVLAFLEDAARAGRLDRTKPAWIVELAAGHGAFSFLFVRRLHALLARSSLAGLTVRCLVTDFAPRNLEALARHPSLSPLREAGLLELGLFDLEEAAAITRWPGGGALEAREVHSPLVILGNYTFGSVKQDLFRFVGGEAREVLVGVRAPEPFDPSTARPEVMAHLRLELEERPIEPSSYYPEPLLGRVLSAYRAHPAAASVTLPVAGLRAVARLAALSPSGFLLLAADKGYVRAEDLPDGGPDIQFHGSLSTTFDLRAFELAFGGPGSLFLVPDHRRRDLEIAALVVGGARDEHRGTALAFDAHLGGLAPHDVLALAARLHASALEPAAFLALLRASRFDPQLLADRTAALLDLAARADQTEAAALRDAILACLDNVFLSGRDLFFELAPVLRALGDPAAGAELCRRSLDAFGEHPLTLGRLAELALAAGVVDDARAAIDRALAIAPAYAPHQALRDRITRGRP